MTPETNAALSALPTVDQVRRVLEVHHNHSVAAERVHAMFLEASQREAPVAEDFIDKFLSQMSHTEVGGVPMDYWDRTLTLQFVEDVRRRLADRPSVTNVSREAIQGVIERFGGPIYGTTEKITDTLFLLQFQSIAPAPGKAADDAKREQEDEYGPELGGDSK